MTSQKVDLFETSELESASKSLNQSVIIKDKAKSKKLLISIIIPVYNEEKTIESVISRIPNHYNYEILIINDGCTDNSIQKIKEIKDGAIKVLHHDKNRGYGAAILTGLKYAKGDIIVTLDSDGQHLPEEIPNLIEPILNNECDIVVGSRYLGICKYKIPLHTRIGENLVDFVLWLLFNQNIKNNQSGFRAFSKESLELFDDLIYNKFGLCTEIIFKAALNGFQIKEVPITVKSRKHGSSYVHLAKITFSIISCILIYGLKKFKLIDFLPKTIISKFGNRNNK